MKIFIGPSGCDLVLEALKRLLKDAENERFDLSYHGSGSIYAWDMELMERENRIRNIKSMIGVYEALKNSYTEEDLKEKLLWMTKEE